MIDSIEKYISILKTEMKGCDAATRQDALSDAEDHLRSAVSEALSANPELSEKDVLQSVIEEYGTPRETADSYMELDRRFAPGETGGLRRQYVTPAGRFFGIFGDGAAWGAVLYSLLSLATGIIYFTWAVTGIALSASMMVLIIGIPVTVAFFFSFRGLAILEGRIVEGLLGVRMPRRQRFLDPDMKWGGKIKRLLLGKDSWLFVLYFILMLPLGIIYFTITVTLFSVSLSLMASPFLGLIFELPGIDLGPVVYGVPYWTLPFIAVLGFLLLKGTLHLLKKLGSLQGKLAKTMLVTEDV